MRADVDDAVARLHDGQDEVRLRGLPGAAQDSGGDAVVEQVDPQRQPRRQLAADPALTLAGGDALACGAGPELVGLPQRAAEVSDRRMPAVDLDRPLAVRVAVQEQPEASYDVFPRQHSSSPEADQSGSELIEKMQVGL